MTMERRVSAVARGLWVGQNILRRGILSTLVELARCHGQAGLDLVPFSLFGRPAYLALDPRDIGAVLHDTDSFRRAELFLKSFRDVLGFNAVTVPADQWQEVRQRTLRFLSGRMLDGYQDIMTRVLEEDTIPGWRRKSRCRERIDVFGDMVDYSSKVVFSAFLGVPKQEVPAHLHGMLNEMFTHVRRRVFSFINVPLWLPTPENRKFRALRTAVDEFVASRIELSRGTGAMLDALVQTHSADGRLNRKHLLEEMLGNLIGGSETTIILMLWTLHYLSHAPALQDRLYDEVAGPAPGLHRSPRNSLLHRCIFEALRIRSPSYLAVRESVRPVRVGGTGLPAGTHVFASQYITHNDPRVWPDPGRFNPDRFLDRIPRTAPDFADFFPFGGGRNVCTGQAYAFQEAAIAVGTLIRHFRLVPTSPLDVGVRPELTLRPAGRIEVLVEERAAIGSPRPSVGHARCPTAALSVQATRPTKGPINGEAGRDA